MCCKYSDQVTTLLIASSSPRQRKNIYKAKPSGFKWKETFFKKHIPDFAIQMKTLLTEQLIKDPLTQNFSNKIVKPVTCSF